MLKCYEDIREFLKHVKLVKAAWHEEEMMAFPTQHIG